LLGRVAGCRVKIQEKQAEVLRVGKKKTGKGRLVKTVNL